VLLAGLLQRRVQLGHLGGVRECSPPLPLIEITAACMATPAWIALVVAAAMSAMLAVQIRAAR